MNLSKYKQDIFQISDASEFKGLALEAFQYQYENVSVYRKFVQLLGVDPASIAFDRIPFLPISQFREKVVSDGLLPQITFRSSGTTNQKRSEHHVHDLAIYHESALTHFKNCIGDPKGLVIACLLPGYVGREDASLLYMSNMLVGESNHPLSGYYLEDESGLLTLLNHDFGSENKTLLLLGVTHALLRLAKKEVRLPENTIIIETGGMKGHGKELTRAELHSVLAEKLKCNRIYSEYGMTELLSQAYLTGDEGFKSPKWMHVDCSDIRDPRNATDNGSLRIIDLANIHSCCFIQTEDLGVIHSNGTFEVTGRLDHSELRGCNLLLN